MPDHHHGHLDRIGQCDHTTTNEYLIFGAPGTGKTKEAARQVRRAVDKYGAVDVLVTSFSRAAAAELAGRDLPIIADNLGTLHALCWRALDGPRIAEVHVDEWNRGNPGLPVTPVKKTKLDGEGTPEDDQQERQGDALLQQLSRFRGLIVPPDEWPADVREFAAKWHEYKRAHGLLDFCDLIEIAHRDFVLAPGSPSVLVADEVQDLNPLQTALVRKWGEKTQYFIRAGDDDQVIYPFAGATADTMLDPQIPSDHKTILEQSYRLPGAVYDLAENLIRTVSRRQPKTYQPRPERGAVHHLTGTYKTPEYAVLNSIEQHLAKGKTVMLLSACSYMLRPLLQVLRKQGIPFHNPYRRSEGFWNPLRSGNRESAANRVRALLGRYSDGGEMTDWSALELRLWAKCLSAPGALRTGALEMLKSVPANGSVSEALIESIFEPDALTSLLASAGSWHSLLNWWRQRVRPDIFRSIQFPVDVVCRRGPETLAHPPQVIVGTIHSVKGGQADVVYLFPDLSRAGANAYSQLGEPRDSVIRIFYVGVTRAREILYICEPAGASSVRL